MGIPIIVQPGALGSAKMPGMWEQPVMTAAFAGVPLCCGIQYLHNEPLRNARETRQGGD